MYPLITAVVALLVIAGLLYVFRRWEDCSEGVLKILTLAFCAIGLFRLFLYDIYCETVFNGEYILQTLLRWGYYSTYAILPMAIFTESRLFRNLATYFSTTMAVLSVVFMYITMDYFLYSKYHGYTNGYIVRIPENWCCILYAAELVLALSIPVLMAHVRKHKMEVRSFKEWFHLIIGLPAILIQFMPMYVPQALIGKTDIDFKPFGEMHLGWIVWIALEIIVLYLLFRRRTATDKYNLLLFLVIAQTFHTTSIFMRGFLMSRIPIQLCSIAAFFYLFTIVFRSRKVFGFCFLANILGAVIDIALAHFDAGYDGIGAFQNFNIHFIYEHTLVVLVPILALALGVFPRLKLRDLRRALVVFSIYFLSSLIIGLIINSNPDIPAPVNYFYMFNFTEALSYVPFAGFTGAIQLNLGIQTIYPILIVVIYMVFVLLISGFYGMMRGIYRLKDRITSAKHEGETAPTVE